MGVTLRIVVAILAAILAFASPSMAARSRPDSPPPGVTATTIKLQTVLDANSAAVGSQAHRSITNIETMAISAYGLTGTVREEYTGLHADDDYRRVIALGPLSWQEGRYKGQGWRQNENGITTNLHPDASAEGSDIRLLEADVTNPKNDVSLLGEVSDPFAAYVVQVKRPNEASYWMFYDKTTSLLTRLEIGYPDVRHVITLDDFRLANGVKVAWHTHETQSGNSANDWDETIKSDVYGAPIPDADLKIPASNASLVQFPAAPTTVTLPSHFFDDDAIVRVSINGRGLDMVLDTAFDGMLLDSQVVKDLRLPTYGPHDSGSDLGDEALVHDMAIGDLTMNDVFVSNSEFYYHETGEVKVVGVIGFDFFASAIVDIDYQKHTVGATQPSRFVPPSTPYIASLNLDDGIPMISAQIGPANGSRFVLDTYSYSTKLYADFWAIKPGLLPSANVLQSADGGLLKGPFAHVVLGQLIVGGIAFGSATAYLISANADDSYDDRDGVFGQEFLSMFHIYFDYPDQRVYLIPAKWLQDLINGTPTSKPTDHAGRR
jgi:Aspartyl protease